MSGVKRTIRPICPVCGAGREQLFAHSLTVLPRSKGRGFDVEFAGFYFGEVQNSVDEGQQPFSAEVRTVSASS